MHFVGKNDTEPTKTYYSSWSLPVFSASNMMNASLKVDSGSVPVILHSTWT